MTAPAPATTPTPAPAPAPAGAPPRSPGVTRTRRRWHRLAVPFVVLVLIYLATGVAHTLQEPDLDDPGTLSPTGTGPDGSSRLAERLAARGVTIHRVTSSRAALDALTAANADRESAVFVPAPDLIDPNFIDLVTAVPGRHRVVLARPGLRWAGYAGFATGPSGWAARAVAPGCAAGLARTAGPAAVLRSRYAADQDDVTLDCYDGGLVGLTVRRTEMVAVGATDPFRNGRIDEVGNSPLATALLGESPDLIWLDVHRPEPVPKQARKKPKLPSYHQPGRQSGGSDPMWTAFPPAFWASLVLLFTVGVLIALVSGRRLGPPVAEPLPAVVPATETVTGRGRLYERIQSRRETLETLRAAALRRMAPKVDPFGGAGRTDPGPVLIDQLAARAGMPPHQVAAILHEPPPEDDEQLQAAVARLDGLLNAVLWVGPAGAAGGSGVGGSVNTGGTTL